MYILSIFAERLDGLRFEKNLNQKQLAQITGIEEASICRYLKGNREPSVNSLIILADFFNCSTDYLLGLVDHDNSQNFKKCISFKTRLSALVKESSKNNSQFCKNVGIVESHFYEWKNGSRMPSVTSIVKIAEFLNRSVDYVLGREV